MPDINPIHSRDEIDASEQPVESQPVPSVQPGTPLVAPPAQEVTASVVPDPVPSNEQSAFQTLESPPPNSTETENAVSKPAVAAGIYPEPKSYEERQSILDSNGSGALKNGSTPVSVFIVALLGVVASLYGLVELVRTYILDSVASINIFSVFNSYLGVWLWVLFAVGVFQLVVMLYASYKLWQGSLAGLAFLTGVSFLYVNTYIYTLVLSIENLDKLPFESIVTLVLYGLFFISLAVVWIKDRKSLS